MKKLSLIFAALAFTFVLTSCGEKCTTCTYTWTVSGQTIETPQPEVCGSKKEVNDYKDGVEAAAQAAGTLIGATDIQTSCVDN